MVHMRVTAALTAFLLIVFASDSFPVPIGEIAYLSGLDIARREKAFCNRISIRQQFMTTAVPLNVRVEKLQRFLSL